MNDYIPDRWVIVKQVDDKNDLSIRILSSWYGGYLGSDAWKLSSKILKFSEEDESYTFYTETGSIYNCYKNVYGMSSLASGVIKNLAEKAKTINTIMTVIDRNDSRRTIEKIK
jgi:hypothetical protein